jgi:GNAT superfamily N-acetyltransferase
VSRFRDPEPLSGGHNLEDFSSGIESLDSWLKKHARQAAAINSARTFVVHDDEQDRIVGYHSLTAASIEQSEATARTAKGMPRHPIPAALLARLAVDRSVQGRGLGAWLLRDATVRTLRAADAIAIRVLLVHAIDDQARSFYARHGFESSPTDPFNLQLLLKDLRAAVGQASAAASRP